MRVGVTGHRPDKLWGYDYDNLYWTSVKELFKQYCLNIEATDVFSGMALGLDTICAIAVLELRDEGYAISLHCVIPCLNHSSKWPEKSKHLYNQILDRAQEVVLVSELPYTPYLMQIRNMYIVDNTDCLWALYDGTSGGTANCVNYAIKQNKPIQVVTPEQVEDYANNVLLKDGVYVVG